MKRLFDIVVSGVGLTMLLPVFLVLAIWIKINSPGPVFFRQIRVGKNNRDFSLYKFRSMRLNSHLQGLITIGNRDSRVTSSGYYIRKYKLDELPQLINVFIGNMSLVGPRPEVRKYVDLYTQDQLKVLSVLPGITDMASVKYRNENELLGKAANPEKFYIEQIMPDKLKYNLEYIEKRSLLSDFSLIFKTLIEIFKSRL